MEELIKALEGIEYTLSNVENNYTVAFKNVDEFKKAFTKLKDIHELCSKYTWFRLQGNCSLVVRI